MFSQGSLLSPMLLDLYISDLIKVSLTLIKLSLIAYVDDFIMIFKYLN
jgi:hypothetical protein